MRLAARTRSVEESATLAIKARATALRAAGRSIIDLSAGEPDGAPPAAAVEAAQRAALAGRGDRYAPVAGIPALREAVAARYRDELGIDSTRDGVVVAFGGKHALYSLFSALLDPGDECVVFTPAWVSYEPQIALCGAQTVRVPCRSEDGFQPDVDGLRAAITERTRVVVLNSPSNPTGCVASRDRLRAIDEICADHGIFVISDEIYRSMTIDGEATCFPALSDRGLTRTAIVDAVSKAYAMTGWRVGFIIAAPELAAACAVLQGHATSGVCAVNQEAALAAWTGPQDSVSALQAGLRARRDALRAGLAGIPGLDLGPAPGGAFYLFPRVDAFFGSIRPDGKRVENDRDVADALLELGGVAVVPGSAFGEPRCVRLSFATSFDAIEQGSAGVRYALTALAARA